MSSENVEIAIDNNSATATISGVASPPAQSLARTGTDASRIAIFGGVLVGLGLLLTAAGESRVKYRRQVASQ